MIKGRSRTQILPTGSLGSDQNFQAGSRLNLFVLLMNKSKSPGDLVWPPDPIGFDTLPSDQENTREKMT